ncbi:MAG: bifunctional DNA primase/polymerase, partial [Scytonema sp. PMC 1070.18]|nr:bifunctional DNA primase/polymerase [Scytonema sp. PMC 1070.18]
MGKNWKLEFRGKNLASILPPSFHPDGRKYKWLPGCSPSEISVPKILESEIQYFPPGISIVSGWNFAFSTRNFCPVRSEFRIF